MSFREFEYADGKSFKFWKIEAQDSDVVTQYGRIGSAGQETKKNFGSPEKAQKEYDKLVAEKLRKGLRNRKVRDRCPARKIRRKDVIDEEGRRPSDGRRRTVLHGVQHDSQQQLRTPLDLYR